MSLNVKINEFEGPLDLLLHLVKESKVDIYEIETSVIIDEYLKYIHLMETMNIDVTSEYLVMASELIHLKSRMLLNMDDEESENDYSINSEEDLKNKLIEYEKYKNKVNEFAELESKRKEVHTKLPESLKEYIDNDIIIQGNMNINDLFNALLTFLEKEKLSKPINTKVTKKEYSVEIRCNEIKDILKIKKRVKFFDLFEEKNRDYVIVTFLSILEMCKNNELIIIQDNNFSDIIIEVR